MSIEHYNKKSRRRDEEDPNMAYYREPPTSNLGTKICDCVMQRRSRAPTFLGWVLIVIIGFIMGNIYYSKGSMGSLGETEAGQRPDIARFQPKVEQLPRVPEAEIPKAKPRPRVPVAPPPEVIDNDQHRDPQYAEFEKVHRKNQEGLEPPQIPDFDPNLHGYEEHKELEAPALERYGPPKPKEWPVNVVLSPRIDCRSDLPLLVLIFTRSEATGARSGIRRTWGQQTEESFGDMSAVKWKILFVMGKANTKFDGMASQEALKFGDILQGEFDDSPFEDTRKFMLAAEWLAKHSEHGCRPHFILRTQDNIFLNMRAIIPWLEARYYHRTGVYIGRLQRNEKPNRDSTDPHYVSLRDFNRDTFPDMIVCPVYMLSWDALSKFTTYMKYTVALAVEDAYLAVVAEKAGITPQHNDHFQMITKPGHLCHHLQLFFLFKVKPHQHIDLFREMVRALSQPECKDMQVMDRAKGFDSNPRHVHGPWPDL